MDKDFRNICDSQTDTYVLRILGTGGDVITSRISLEYSGSNGRTIMGTFIRHQNMGSKICRNHNCRLWLICILQEADRRLSAYENVFYDYEEGVFPFLIDYLAVMILIAFIGYYSGVFLKKTGKRKRKGSY